MDSNGTRFHLLQGRPDWARCTDAAGIPLADEWSLSPLGVRPDAPYFDDTTGDLTLQERVFRFPAAPKDVAPNLDNRRGAARDCGGNWYWVGDSRKEILVLSSGDQSVSRFWPRPDSGCEPPIQERTFGPLVTPEPCPEDEFAGLAVTTDHYLAVGSTAVGGLLIFDLANGGLPRRVLWPEAVELIPADMAPAAGGGVFVLDRHNQRYWRLNRHFYVIGERPAASATAGIPDFIPEGGQARRGSPCATPAEITEQLATRVGSPFAVSIEALSDGSVLILESDPGQPDSLVWWYRCGVPVGPPASTEGFRAILEAADRPAAQLLAVDFAAIEDGAHTYLYFASADGNQSFAFTATFAGDQLELAARKEYYPMRLFAGKALVAAGGQVWYDFPQRWVPLIAQRRKRYEPLGEFLTPPLDGRDPDCVWHRLFIDACVPDETAIQISTRCSNSRGDVEDLAWRVEPPLYTRPNGSEIPLGSVDGRPTRELLFQQARGRWLQIRVQMTGQERDTPRLRALRAYYPRFSYLDRYLPSIYREDRTSASFLDRFLSNFEGTLTSVEDRIAAAQALFDARSAPAEALPWLASWFGLAFDPAWSTAKRRLFLQNAMQFFAWRGTLRGMLEGLRLAMNDCAGPSTFTDSVAEIQQSTGIRIVEAFRVRSVPSLIPGSPVASGTRWQPSDGGAALNQRYRSAIAGDADVTYPLTAPAGTAALQAWQNFSESSLGFTPVTGAGYEPQWQAFLMRRYRTAAALQGAWGPGATAYANVTLPAALPADGAPLKDWSDFQSFAVRARAYAHRFTVLLPVHASDTGNSEAQQTRRKLVQRILDLEKPAHTLPSIQFYWAVFRAGYVRLGEGTVLGQGSRAPEMLSPLILGQAYLSETYLGAPANRQVLTKGCIP